LLHHFVQHSGGLLISAVSLAELYVWANRANDPTRRIDEIDRMLRDEVALILYDQDAARCFGVLKRQLQTQGVVVQEMDLLIASTAMANNLTLVTHNVKHFEVIADLRVEDWLSP
jgi:predicted nucleic acid-binding protein